jgi:hypothetical protein
MTKVAIFPYPTAAGTGYAAVAGDKRSRGATAGQALDALTALLPQDTAGTLIIVQSQRPDTFFSAAQRVRLEELMALWRAARARGGALPQEAQAELEALAEAELLASGARAEALADESGR